MKILFFIFLLCACSLSKDSNEFTIDFVVDGDTIVLDNGESVRLIGVDAPEKSHPLRPVEFYSAEATEFMKSMTLHKRVNLEYGDERRDKYNRLLAYVYLLDGSFVNKELVEKGFAFAYTRFPFKYFNEFVDAEAIAKREGLGIWQDGGLKEYKWLLQNESVPVLLFQMSGPSWGIQYQNYFLPHVKNDTISFILDSLRLWINEYSEKDLNSVLINNSWLIIES